MLKQVLSVLVVSMVAGGAALAAEPGTNGGAQTAKAGTVTASIAPAGGTQAKKHAHARTIHKAAATAKDAPAAAGDNVQGTGTPAK